MALRVWEELSVCRQAHFSPVHLLSVGLPFKVSGPYNCMDTNKATGNFNIHLTAYIDFHIREKYLRRKAICALWNPGRLTMALFVPRKDCFEKWYGQPWDLMGKERLQNKSVHAFGCVHVCVCGCWFICVKWECTVLFLIVWRVVDFDRRVAIATLLSCFIDRVPVLMFLSEMWPMNFLNESRYELWHKSGLGKELWSSNQGHGSGGHLSSAPVFQGSFLCLLQPVYYQTVRILPAVTEKLYELPLYRRIRREICVTPSSKPQTLSQS